MLCHSLEKLWKTRGSNVAMPLWRNDALAPQGFPWGKEAKLVVSHTFPKAQRPLAPLYSATASRAQAIAWRCSAS